MTGSDFLWWLEEIWLDLTNPGNGGSAVASFSGSIVLFAGDFRRDVLAAGRR